MTPGGLLKRACPAGPRLSSGYQADPKKLVKGTLRLGLMAPILRQEGRFDDV